MFRTVRPLTTPDSHPENVRWAGDTHSAGSTHSAGLPGNRGPLSRRTALLSLTALPAVAFLAACGDGGTSESGTGDSADADQPADGADQPEGGNHSADAGEGLTVTDPWVKAAEDGMTSAFGTITNNTDTDLVLTSVTTEASEMVELHQTAEDGTGGMSMEEKEGGFPIPAGEDLLLEPGGDHIMLMSLTAPLSPGEEVEFMLVFEDGNEHPVTATVKDFAGANENYDPEADDAHDGHGEHGQGEHGGDEEEDH